MKTHLGLVTARTCPSCAGPMQVVMGVAMCLDREICRYNELTGRHWEILRDAFEQVAA